MVCGSNSIRRDQCTTNGQESLSNKGISSYNPTVTGTHVKIGLLALCLALLIAVPAAWLSGSGAPQAAATDIAVEHTLPLTLRIARLASSGTNVFEVGFVGRGTGALHLPSSWTRQEVRGAALASVTSEPTEWNFVRWVLPAGAVVRFDAPNPGRVTLHNPSGIPLTVRTTTVHAITDVRDDDARIVTDEPYLLP